MLNYDPRDWYWLADDGRVYASARQTVVDKMDEAFLARQKAGGVTRWPTDDAGAQTATSMLVLVRPYGLAVPGAPREAIGYVLISALTDGQVAALATAKARDQRLLSARVDPWPEDNPKIARIAVKVGIAPAAWFDLALAPPSA